VTFLGTLVFQVHYFRGPAIPLAAIGLLAFEARRLTRHRFLRPAVEMLSAIVVASAVLI